MGFKIFGREDGGVKVFRRNWSLDWDLLGLYRLSIRGDGRVVVDVGVDL